MCAIVEIHSKYCTYVRQVPPLVAVDDHHRLFSTSLAELFLYLFMYSTRSSQVNFKIHLFPPWPSWVLCIQEGSWLAGCLAGFDLPLKARLDLHCSSDWHWLKFQRTAWRWKSAPIHTITTTSTVLLLLRRLLLASQSASPLNERRRTYHYPLCRCWLVEEMGNV